MGRPQAGLVPFPREEPDWDQARERSASQRQAPAGRPRRIHKRFEVTLRFRGNGGCVLCAVHSPELIMASRT